MEYFEKPEIDLAQKKLIAIFTAHNERQRIPFFLSYYREMGVQHFLAIDNNSQDDSKKLLQEQPDVTYFFTDKSYVESKAGRLWTSELANHYCQDKWCLTLDLDEQLVFPGCEMLTLTDLIEYLDNQACDGIFCVFLDMYSAKPLSDAIYSPGRPFLEVCDHFEVASYSLRRPQHFPQLLVLGGPRQRVFWQGEAKGSEPSMRKMPLIKWRKGFAYVYSTHSATPVRLANVTGALLHFKFFSFFKSFAEREVARGDRVQKEHYENYVRLSREQDISFKADISIKYESSNTLVEHGVMTCDRGYLEWMQSRSRRSGRSAAAGAERDYWASLEQVMNTAFSAAELKLSQLPVIWELINRTTDSQLLWVKQRTIGGIFLDLRGFDPKATIEARVGGKVVAETQTGRVDWPHAALNENARLNYAGFELTAPPSIFWPKKELVVVALAAQGARFPFAYVSLYRRTHMREDMPFEGECEDDDQGKIRGWVWRRDDPTMRLSVSVHVDGKYWISAAADQPRVDLLEHGKGDGGHGFSIDLPDWLDPAVEHRVDVLVNATNLNLSRSPLRVAGSIVTHMSEKQALAHPIPATSAQPGGAGSLVKKLSGIFQASKRK